MTLRVIPGRLAALDGDILSINLSREKSLVLFEHSRQPRLLIDGPQSAAGTADTPRNEAALISTRTKVGKASPSMSSLRVKGYSLSCFYGFIDLKCQVTDCMLQRLGLLIERIHSLQKAVGIADVSRTLCLSSEVELANDNEAVSDAS
jgi:hypothetical protein